MAHSIDTLLIEELAREGVVEIAPEELLTFQRTADAYRKDPAGTLDQSPRGEEALGFGIGEAVVLVSPVALAVAADVLKFVYSELREFVIQEGGEALADRLRRLFQRDGARSQVDDHAVDLSSEQLSRVHQIATERARQFLPIEQAELLADSMAGALALSPA